MKILERMRSLWDQSYRGWHVPVSLRLYRLHFTPGTLWQRCPHHMARLQRAVKMISGGKLSAAQVEIIFALFELEGGSDSLDPVQFEQAISRRHCRGLRRGEDGARTDQSLVECLLACCGWQA